MNIILDQWRAELTVPDRPDEYEVKRLLSRLGLNVPRGIRIGPAAIGGVPEFSGPFVAKVCSPDIVHKTDLHGVHLNLGPQDLAMAMGALRDAFPETAILVEQMVSFDGPEMIAGGLIDPGFGPAVMVGAGGIGFELMGSLRIMQYQEVAAILLVILAMVTLVDAFSGVLRKRFK